MLMHSHPSQQHAGLHLAVWHLQQEVTMPRARFKPISPEKSKVDDKLKVLPKNSAWKGVEMYFVGESFVLNFAYVIFWENRPQGSAAADVNKIFFSWDLIKFARCADHKWCFWNLPSAGGFYFKTLKIWNEQGTRKMNWNSFTHFGRDLNSSYRIRWPFNRASV